MNIPETPRKLQKKRVSFNPSSANESIAIITPNPLTPGAEPQVEDTFTPYASYFPEYDPILSSTKSVAPFTPDPTPPAKRQTPWLNKFRLTSPTTQPDLPITSTPIKTAASDDEWHHHQYYFPEYEPIYPHTSTYDPWARAYPLSPAEMQARQQSAALGHAVAIHYPALPRFAEYNSGGGADQAKAGWTSGKYGAEGWTGCGWEGEKLPNADGASFAAPMPKGVPLEGEGKKKGGGGGGGGKKKKEEGEEGDGEKEEGGEGGEGGEHAGEPAVAGGEEGATAEAADSGSRKSKKKKK